MPIGVTASLEYELGSGWAAVPKVRTVTFPQFSTSSIDTTHLGITDFAMTFEPGMVDAGTVSFEAEYTSAGYTALQGLVRETLGWRISAPDDLSDAVTCDGFLTNLNVSLSPNELVVITGDIKMTGLPAVS